jgi:hypothetical protein
MSALGQERPFSPGRPNARFAPTADIRRPYKLDQGRTEVGRDSTSEKPRAGLFDAKATPGFMPADSPLSRDQLEGFQ